MVDGEAPPPGETLLELKAFGAFLDHMVRTTMTVPAPDPASG